MPRDECVSDGLGNSFRARAGSQPETVRKSCRPALWTRCSPPRGPAGTQLGVGGPAGEMVTGPTLLPNIEPWEDLPDGEVGTNGSDPSLGGRGGRWDAPAGIFQGNGPSGGRWGQPRLGCSCWLEHPKDAAPGHPPPTPRGMRSCWCPSTAPAARGRQVWSGRWPRGQRRGPVRPGCARRQLAHDPRRGAKV